MALEKELYVYNSMTKQKEKFVTKVQGKVGMYVCGVTAYDYSHIGHARAYVSFDLLYRFLKHLGYQVTYVRNFTDVDDKIIRRATERNEDPISLSKRFSEEFLKDMADLQCLPPTSEPRVSDHIGEIIKMIEQIISNGCAYIVSRDSRDKDVYFSVDNFPNYGRLSRRKTEDNRAGERIAVDSRKRNPADFALWKAAKDEEPISWDSPWGKGRPGWHIECSAMSAVYLTHSFDIHGGGMDLIFPHHENEIAQNCAACPDSNVSYWMHNGFVTANDEKMSKSLGNFFTIREVTDLYHPLALRHLLLGTHYRSPVKYSTSQMDKESKSLYSIYQTLEDCKVALTSYTDRSQNEGSLPNGKTASSTSDARKCISNLRDEFERNLADDLHTPTILKCALRDALKLMNKLLDQLKKKQQKKQQLSTIQSLVELETEVKSVLDVLGLLSSSSPSEVLQQLKEKALKRAHLAEQDVIQKIEERALAKENKEFSRADQIRTVLLSKGIALMDIVGSETGWRPCVPEE